MSDAEERLKQLEEERRLLDEQLKIAHDRIKLSEDTKEILETRLQQVVPLRDGDRIRRAFSFMSSTKERPVILDIKSATLRRPSKQ